MNERGSRVLIVDDDADIRANFSDILSDLGYQTTTAEDGVAALRCIRESRFDVVLLDYQMPGMDGASLYREIKKLQPSIAAIMITAWAGSDGAQQAKNAGTWDVLRKPVDIPDLLEKLSRAATAPIVLVVDDDEEFCQSLWQILNLKHFRVALAHSEAEGISRAADSKYQVAIVDLKLGSGDGRKVIRRIHRAIPEARTIIVSGDQKTAADAYEELGDQIVNAVCAKPIDVEQLLTMIESETGRN
ncbi:Response regulator receiver protein [Stieleria maiorica]|uniref:Response regulator receiver protein n=1 Tax=Stieleria maiorica TaxID=2795974 RepID=A0A5B9MBY5_9BACT|nr:response regulator [Stieleria maiorica]QEF98821.1 Response regulator receiver protein [Stieleria maiorica]